MVFNSQRDKHYSAGFIYYTSLYVLYLRLPSNLVYSVCGVCNCLYMHYWMQKGSCASVTTIQKTHSKSSCQYIIYIHRYLYTCLRFVWHIYCLTVCLTLDTSSLLLLWLTTPKAFMDQLIHIVWEHISPSEYSISHAYSDWKQIFVLGI